MIKFFERWQWLIFAVVFAIFIVVVFVSEGQAQSVTAINCGDGWLAIEADSPEIIETFDLIDRREWRLPANSKHKDALTRPAYTLRFSDGSEMLVTLSGTLTVEYNAVSKGLLWYDGEPDWRNIGDGNPHPDELYLLDADDAVAILEYC